MPEQKTESNTKIDQPAKSRETLSPEEAIKTVVYIQEAIINILQEKGIADRTEIMEEVRNIAKAIQ